MSEQGPKLFANKPKKAKLKAVTPSTVASTSSTGAQTVTPPPPPTPTQPRESFARRYKFLWPLSLAVSFTVGAYFFTRTIKKDVGTEEAKIPDVPTPSASTPAIAAAATTATATATAAAATTATATAAVAATLTEEPVTQTVMEPLPLVPISDDQQRELYKWLLEEKRKVKPKDAEEKKRIDEEKAILKQFIRSKSLPSL